MSTSRLGPLSGFAAEGAGAGVAVPVAAGAGALEGATGFLGFGPGAAGAAFGFRVRPCGLN